MLPRLKKRCYEILNTARHGDIISRVFDIFLISLILVNAIAFILATDNTIYAKYKEYFNLLRQFSFLFFSLEFLLRLWTCTEQPSGVYRQPVSGRLKFLKSPLMLIDLLVIVPFWIGISGKADFRILRLFRLPEILRITHHSPVLGVMAIVLKRESKTLAAIFLIMAMLLFFSATAVYYLEHESQPDTFSSIPHAMWWAMSTLSTVGYGDVLPQGVAGKVFAMFVMFIGIGMFAIPTGILVSSFSQEMKRKDFIVIWKLVAQVPYFSRLNALEIAAISDLLRLHTAMQGEVIFRRGEVADSMYFIVAGEMEVKLDKETVRLKGGDFFGEVSLLYRTSRTATVAAKTVTELLRLEARDFETLLESNQTLREKIISQAETRIARSANSGG